MKFPEFKELVESCQTKAHIFKEHWNGITTITLGGIWSDKVACPLTKVDSRKFVFNDDFEVAVNKIEQRFQTWLEKIHGVDSPPQKGSKSPR